MRRGQRALEKLGPGALFAAVLSEREAMPEASARELGRLAGRDGWARRFLLDLVRGKLGTSADVGVPALQELARVDPDCVLALVQGDDLSAGLAAGKALGREGRRFHRELVELTKDPDVHARLAGLAGLGEAAATGCEGAVEEAAARLEDPDGQVRWAAAAALGRARGADCAERAVRSLEAVIDRGDEPALSGAAFGAVALWSARRREGARLLLKAAEAGPAGRRAAAVAMGELPRRAALPVARACVEDQDPDVRALSAAALARWAREENASAWRDLARLAHDRHAVARAAAAEVFARQGTWSHLSLVEQLSGDHSSLVRRAVAEGIAERRDQEFAHILCRLAADAVVSVRAAAIRALGAIGVRGLVRDACLDTAPVVRRGAAAALQAGSPEDTELLLGLSRDRDGAVVRAAARTLGRHVFSTQGPVWQRLVELASDRITASAAAEGMAAALDRHLEAAADVFWEWPVGEIAPQVLGQICRFASSPEVVELARTADRALDADEALPDALRDLSAAFLGVGRRNVGDALLWLAECAGAGSPAAIAEAASSAPTSKLEAVSHLAAISGAQAVAARTRSGQVRPRQLARATAALRTCLAHEACRPEWVFVHRIARRWHRLIEVGAEPAPLGQVRARLTSDRLVAGPAPTLLVELENIGGEPVSQVSVSVRGAPAAVQAPDLAPGGRAEVEVRLGAAEPGASAVRGAVRFRCGEKTGEGRFTGRVRALRPAPLDRVTNPFVVGKPLRAESTMFFGRGAELSYVERALASGESGSVVVLVGQRRTGKTSLLRRLEARLADQYRPVFVDVQGMLPSDTGEFFEELAQRAMSGHEAVPMLADGSAPMPGASIGAEMVREIAGRSDRRMVLLLDEFDDLENKVESGRLSQDVFSQLRNLIQHSENMSLVLCGTHRLEALAGDYWSFLLNLATYRRVGCLTREDAQDLVRVPLQRLGIVCEDAAVSRALAFTGCQPYFLQLLGYRLVERCIESGEAAVRADMVEQVADEVVAQGEIHLRYLWESGGLSGQPILRALSGSEDKLTKGELDGLCQLDPGRLDEALIRLSALELIDSEAGRCALRIGLLGRWLRAA